MQEYHKIQSVYLRDPATKHKTFLEGQYTTDAFRYLAYTGWIFREKIDGTNIRIHHGPTQVGTAEGGPGGEHSVVFYQHKVIFGGRTERAQIPAPLANHLNQTFTVEKFQEAGFDHGITLYGEGYGAGIQKGGGNYRPDQGFILFDVKVGNWWLKQEDVEDVARKLGVPYAPIIGYGTLPEMVELCRAGFKSQFEGVTPEGIVAVPEVDLSDRQGHRVITKCKLVDFNNGK